jgi:hypothetical protein
MFKWLHTRRGESQRQNVVADPQQAERGSGEEEYESHEEREEEVAPSGMTRAKTDKL